MADHSSSTLDPPRARSTSSSSSVSPSSPPFPPPLPSIPQSPARRAPPGGGGAVELVGLPAHLPPVPWEVRVMPPVTGGEGGGIWGADGGAALLGFGWSRERAGGAERFLEASPSR